MLEYLFVYGTLHTAKDGSKHPDLKSAQFLGNAIVHGKLYLIDYYPGIVISSTDNHECVRGEIYRLLDPAPILQKLDDYEECSPHFPSPHEYQRTSCIATLPDGSTIRTWIYTFQHSTEHLTQLNHGDFWAYLPASYD